MHWKRKIQISQKYLEKIKIVKNIQQQQASKDIKISKAEDTEITQSQKGVWGPICDAMGRKAQEA